MKWVLALVAVLCVSMVALAEERKVDVACYYFPNYHVGEPRHEKEYGRRDWNEWELVKKAKPLFPGHRQPKVPVWGYEDEADPGAMARKIDAAADHGVDAFIFDWYWYGGTPFLEKCLNDGFLKARNCGRIKFALMWANHDWTDIFPVVPGKPQRLMYPGKVTQAEFDALCDHVIRDYFAHPAYWRVEGKPYFSIYELFRLVESFGGVERTRAALDRFREKARAAGLPGIHLNAVVWGVKILPGETVVKNPEELLTKLGFDSVTSYVWIHHVWPEKEVTDYAEWREKYFEYMKRAERQYPVPYLPNVTVGWDGTPRNYQPTRVITGNTPERFGEALQVVKERLEKREQGPRVMTVNCWNEWTEGGYLEPDEEWGMRYLEEMKRVMRGAK